MMVLASSILVLREQAHRNYRTRDRAPFVCTFAKSTRPGRAIRGSSVQRTDDGVGRCRWLGAGEEEPVSRARVARTEKQPGQWPEASGVALQAPASQGQGLEMASTCKELTLHA